MSSHSPRTKVEQLLRLKFPLSWVPPPLSITNTAQRADAWSMQRHTEYMQKVEAERRELLNKSATEIDALLLEAQQAEANKAALKASIDEKGRFFNYPSARADFDHWSKAEYWSLDEAVALLLGRSPEVVSWKTVQAFVNVSEFAKQYERLRNLALRAQAMNRGQSAVYRSTVLAWAGEIDVPVPPGLREAIDARQAKRSAPVPISQPTSAPSEATGPAPQPAKSGPSAAVQERPLQAQAAQEEAILAKLVEMNYAPEALPKAEAGRSGVKATVRSAIGTNALFQSQAVFDKAWQRLRDSGRIADG